MSNTNESREREAFKAYMIQHVNTSTRNIEARTAEVRGKIESGDTEGAKQLLRSMLGDMASIGSVIDYAEKEHRYGEEQRARLKAESEPKCDADDEVEEGWGPYIPKASEAKMGSMRSLRKAIDRTEQGHRLHQNLIRLLSE